MVSRTGQENTPKNNRKAFGSATNILLALMGLLWNPQEPARS
ncbi:MAG TPA: hypothetical protein VK556_10380 [Candidatus Udaeobacter sp.]|nr:hypothetical protein [Candidatus Udaeobacter sp.]